MLWSLTVAIVATEQQLAASATCSVLSSSKSAASIALSCVAADYGDSSAPLGITVRGWAQRPAVFADEREYGCEGDLLPCARDGINSTCLAILKRGGCPFASKARRAQAAGYRALVLVDNAEEASPPGLGAGAGVDIAVVAVGRSTGEGLLKHVPRGAPLGQGEAGQGIEGKGTLLSITLTVPSAQGAKPTSTTAYFGTGVVGGLVNQMWTILNVIGILQGFVEHATMSGEPASATLVPPALSLNNENGPMVQFSYFYDIDRLRQQCAILGIEVASDVGEDVPVPHTSTDVDSGTVIVSLSRSWQQSKPLPARFPVPLSAYCAAQLLKDVASPPPRAELWRRASEERVVCLAGAYTFSYGGPLDCALCSVRDRSLTRPLQQLYLLQPSMRFAKINQAMVARLHQLQLQSDTNTASGFTAVHVRIEDDFRQACDTLWSKDDHPTHCWVDEASISAELKRQGLNAGSWLFVASGAPLSAMSTLCADFRCITKEELWPQHQRSKAGIDIARETLAFVDFNFALQAERFFGNAWSTFSVELLDVHRSRGNQANFYNTWRNYSRREWGIVDPPPHVSTLHSEEL